MNRHSSNPFLSDWDDAPQEQDIATAIQQARSMVPTGTDQVAATRDPQQQQARRSSLGETESGSGSFVANAAARQALYRRNMSSFEAASLQLQQHQQQMLENGSTNLSHTDLIAKMTAEFQSAISTNDKDFTLDGENINFNPFDPFETIVDDDVPLPSSAIGVKDPLSSQGRDNDFESQEQDRSLGQEHLERTNKSKRHDSIDDDEEDLVSTPVRNIKSSDLAKSFAVANQHKENGDNESGRTSSTRLDGVPDNEAMDAHIEELEDQLGESDSRKKASIFASLLASAELSPATRECDDELGQNSINPDKTVHEKNHSEVHNNQSNSIGQDEDYVLGQTNVENYTHVIKGSPNSAGGDPDRPVSFFDPFETVIDKDALSELMESGTTAAAESKTIDGGEPLTDEFATNVVNEGTLGSGSNLDSKTTLESGSLETVIEKSAEDVVQSEVLPEGDSCLENEDNDEPTLTRAHLYDSSMALRRPAGRKLEQPSSGVVAPQPTPMRRPRQKAANSKHQKKPSFQEDSSDSNEDDDRIQIVIRAKEDINGGRREAAEGEARGDAGSGSTGEAKQQVIVPLLPPPPSKTSMKQARERGQVEDMPSPIMSYRSRQAQQQTGEDAKAKKVKKHKLSSSSSSFSDEAKSDDDKAEKQTAIIGPSVDKSICKEPDRDESDMDDDGGGQDEGQFVIPMRHSDLEDEDGDNYGTADTPLYDDDTSYVLEEFPPKYDGPGWEMMLRYPPKKKLTSNRFWKKIFVKLAQVPLVLDAKSKLQQQHRTEDGQNDASQFCWALQIFDKQEDKKPMQEIPLQATYTVSEISSQMFDQFGKIFTIKLQYIFYKERVGVRQGQLARLMNTGHIGSSTTSGGHGVDHISIGAIKRMGAPIEHSPQISQIIKLGCNSYEDIKQFKESLEDCLFRMPIHRDRALSTYKTEEVQMAVRDETYIEVNQIGTITRQMARVRLFFLSFLNGNPIVEVGINDIHRQGREVVGRMDILPVVTEEWIRLEAWELHSTVEIEEFDKPESRLVKLAPPDATFFELMRFRVRPPRNRELPLQVSANMSVTRTKVIINCEVMVPGCVSRKHGQIPCENIAIRINIPECWIYFFREEKHFRMGSKKSVNRRPGKVKGIERFLGGSGGLQDIDDESSLIEVSSGQAKYEHHHHAVVWRAARWPKESQSAYVHNTMKIRLPLTAYDKMPESFSEHCYVEYTMPATTVSHTTLRSISVNPCDDEPPEKYVKYSAKYEYKVKMRLSVNLGSGSATAGQEVEPSPIVMMKKQPDLKGDLQKEEDSNDDSDLEEEQDGAKENQSP